MSESQDPKPATTVVEPVPTDASTTVDPTARTIDGDGRSPGQGGEDKSAPAPESDTAA